MPTILVIDPNGSTAVTAALDAAVAPLRLPAGPVTECVTLAEGPPGIAMQRDADGVVGPLVRLVAGSDAAALALPSVSRAAEQTALRFVPVIDLAFTDPVYSGAQVSRNHGFMVFDTLCGIDAALEVEVPFRPLGEYKQPPAYRTTVAGILDGTAVFRNARPAWDAP